ncbi:GntR family transcriptional regulator [Pelagibius litoralis]|uniref:GntR family transcriptional regulator n=1 Tax=Pelagibius litoralis TaxID=374515 RepID=A0A967EX60_9PROT|nr:GntR family transcriptional regulator [Pelagibius litoralis]NIA67865.1 GntR family transcriptional regulator [Pelagibius litoralis]
MRARKSGNALHEAVREEIARRVQSGEFDPEVPLPSAASLAEEFNVSLITTKRALRDLQSAGILRSVPGLGTFVREQRRFIRNLDLSLTSMDDARRLGFTPSIQLISITREKMKDLSFDVLSIPSEPMLCVRKLVLADDIPIMFDTAFITKPLSDSVVDEFGTKFIYQALADNDSPVTATRLMIDAAPASPEVQQHFAVPNGYPALRRAYEFKTSDPSLKVFGCAESPFDRLACTFDLPPAD